MARRLMVVKLVVVAVLLVRGPRVIIFISRMF